MTTHIMLDLETWGKRAGCDIRSIGAVVFDPVAGTVHSELGCYQFHLATENPLLKKTGVDYFDDMDMRKYSLTRDPETVQWWSDQSPEAQAAFANPVDLRDACARFANWIGNIVLEISDTRPSDLRIWANGPHFDVSILEAVYHAVGLPVPWHYRAPRDFRTITDAAGMTREEFSNYGDAHNALHDAIAQAMTVCEAYDRLGLRTPAPRTSEKPLHDAGGIPVSPAIELIDDPKFALTDKEYERLEALKDHPRLWGTKR